MKTPLLAMVALVRLACIGAGFSVDFTVDLAAPYAQEALYELPGVVSIGLRQANDGAAAAGYDTWLANYVNFPVADGNCPVLEAVTADGLRLGIPLGALVQPEGAHHVRFTRRKAVWTIDVDGCRDEEFPQEEFAWPTGAVGKAVSPRVRDLKLSVPEIPEAPIPDARPLTRPVQYWTPDGHDAWVGDVAVCQWKDRFHLFYLFDRRHHQSKKRGGGHVFSHLSSPDLIHWVEHPNATALTEVWESHGTGTPFEFDGKFCLAHGHHSERFVPDEKTTIPFLDKWTYDHSREGIFRFSELKGVPVGGTYVESTDGIHFRPTNLMISRDENPSVYRRADGRWGLGRAHGLWVTDSPKPQEWYRYDEKTETLGDCPCPFDWNGWHYIIQGFCFFSMSPTGAPGTFKDRVMSDEHPYDGLSVPMVSPWKGNRRIIAGWIRFPGCWGGYLCLRELVQHEDGTLGIKWLEEVTPQVEVTRFDLAPKRPLAVRYRSLGGGKTLVLTVDPSTRRASWRDQAADGTLSAAPTLAESTAVAPRRHSDAIKARPDFVESYSVANLRGLDRPAAVRVIAHYDRKSNVTIFDAEIAGDRTMLCVRHGRFEREALK